MALQSAMGQNARKAARAERRGFPRSAHVRTLAGSCSMSRYYFNLVGPEGVIIDPEGVEVSDNGLEQAIPRILEEVRSEEPELFDVGGGWSLEVVDVEGRKIATFPL
jgi:hypothetical protein